MIEDVEDFAAELQVETLAEVPGFAERTVPIGETGPTEDVAAHVAEGSDSIGIHNGTALDVAAAFLVEAFKESGRVGGGKAGRVIRVTRFDERDRVGLRPLDVLRVADDVPAIVAVVVEAFAGAGEIGIGVEEFHRIATLNGDEAGDLPTFAHLKRRADSGDFVCRGE